MIEVSKETNIYVHTCQQFCKPPSMDEEFLLPAQHQFPSPILTSSIGLVSGKAEVQ